MPVNMADSFGELSTLCTDNSFISADLSQPNPSQYTQPVESQSVSDGGGGEVTTNRGGVVVDIITGRNADGFIVPDSRSHQLYHDATEACRLAINKRKNEACLLDESTAQMKSIVEANGAIREEILKMQTELDDKFETLFVDMGMGGDVVGQFESIEAKLIETGDRLERRNAQFETGSE